MSSPSVVFPTGQSAQAGVVVLIDAPPTTSAPMIHAVDPPAVLALHDQARLRAAAHRAKRLHPGPVGELIHRELIDWSEFGFRFDKHGLVGRLVTDMMSAPLPKRSTRVEI